MRNVRTVGFDRADGVSFAIGNRVIDAGTVRTIEGFTPSGRLMFSEPLPGSATLRRWREPVDCADLSHA